MAAFSAAIALGFRYLETDVHATTDGVLIAFHDDRLDRVTNARGVVAELAWSDVQPARIDGREPIARFEELLDAWPQVRINIDPKHDAAVGPLLDLIEQRGAADRVCIGSFDARRVRAARARFGSAGCTALTRREVAGLWLRSRLVPGKSRGALRDRAALATDATSGGRCVQVPVSVGSIALVDRRLIDRAHHEGLPVHVWTIDEGAEMDRLLDLGVDGVMSDEPALLRDVLVRRGAWNAATDAGAGTIER